MKALLSGLFLFIGTLNSLAFPDSWIFVRKNETVLIMERMRWFFNKFIK